MDGVSEEEKDMNEEPEAARWMKVDLRKNAACHLPDANSGVLFIDGTHADYPEFARVNWLPAGMPHRSLCYHYVQ